MCSSWPTPHTTPLLPPTRRPLCFQCFHTQHSCSTVHIASPSFKSFSFLFLQEQIIIKDIIICSTLTIPSVASHSPRSLAPDAAFFAQGQTWPVGRVTRGNGSTSACTTHGPHDDEDDAFDCSTPTAPKPVWSYGPKEAKEKPVARVALGSSAPGRSSWLLAGQSFQFDLPGG